MIKENRNLKYAIYLRKSTDSEDRQVQSIEDQEKEINILVEREGIKKENIIEIFKESKSAKKPGREEFNRMMCLIKEGKIDSVMCWKLNRLARNPIDGGEIQWLLQQNIIKSILTNEREYLPTDNVLMMAVELGMANQFVLDLSKDVKRGMRGKVEKGWRPMRAPIGYINDKAGNKGEKKIFRDETRFDIVRKCWELLFTRKYTVPEITEIANETYGLRDYKGEKINNSTFYKIFRNTFYYGEFSYCGEVYQGKHEPMITKTEFEYAQDILSGSKHNKRPKTKNLPYNGIITCGECGCYITSEEKIKYVKSENKVKNYVYNKCCSNNRCFKCSQKPIKYEELSEQVKKYLETIKITDKFFNFALMVFKERNMVEEENRNSIIRNLQSNHTEVIKKIDNLINLFVSQNNQNRELLSEDEYISQKSFLAKEKIRIEQQIKDIMEETSTQDKRFDDEINFVHTEIEMFDNGSYEKRTQILRKMGESFILKDGMLDIQLKKVFLTFTTYQSEYKKREIELSNIRNFSEFKTKKEADASFRSIWSG